MKAAKNTFIFYLHEKNSFNEALFHEYIESVRSVTADNTGKDDLIAVIEANSYIIRCALYHFLPDDLFVMENFPASMGEYIEQLNDENVRLIRQAVHGF
ncbi:MAG: hypothetical protein LBD12_00685 [Clostridiales Family XIII bacterium]|nr:hypothetical protein [Clostridiales Family XIII bacterium]